MEARTLNRATMRYAKRAARGLRASVLRERAEARRDAYLADAGGRADGDVLLRLEHDIERYRRAETDGKRAKAEFARLAVGLAPWVVGQLRVPMSDSAREELTSEAYGLLAEAVERYDPYRGIQFSTYYARCAAPALVRFYNESMRSCVTVSSDAAKERLALEQVTARFYAETHGGVPSASEQAEMMRQVTGKAYDRGKVAALVPCGPTASIYCPVDDDGSEMVESLPSPLRLTNEDACADSLEELVEFALDSLSVYETAGGRKGERYEALRRRNCEIVLERAFSDKSLEEIGAEHGISRERVRQIVAHVQGKLKELGLADEAAAKVARMSVQRNYAY